MTRSCLARRALPSVITARLYLVVTETEQACDADRVGDTMIGPGVRQIDTLLGGWERVTAGYLIEGPEPVLVETGSQSSVGELLSALDDLGVAADALAGIAVTHIHLDHAGGVGDVARAFPNA